MKRWSCRLFALATIALIAALTLLARPGAAAAPARPAPKRVRAIPDSTIGLARASVFAVPTPVRVKPEGSSPGDRPRRPRPYATAPPQVPHDVAGFLPITRAENQCIDCHSRAGAAENEAIPMPNSHYTNLRRDPLTVGTAIAGARYVCVSCHASGSDAVALVGNPGRR